MNRTAITEQTMEDYLERMGEAEAPRCPEDGAPMKYDHRRQEWFCPKCEGRLS